MSYILICIYIYIYIYICIHVCIYIIIILIIIITITILLLLLLLLLLIIMIIIILTMIIMIIITLTRRHHIVQTQSDHITRALVMVAGVLCAMKPYRELGHSRSVLRPCHAMCRNTRAARRFIRIKCVLHCPCRVFTLHRHYCYAILSYVMIPVFGNLADQPGAARRACLPVKSVWQPRH